MPEKTDNPMVTAVPKDGTSNMDVGQSLSVLEIIKIRQLRRKMSPEAVKDYKYSFDERSAIREFEGGLGREEAEHLAQDECADAMMQQYPELSTKMTKLLIRLL
jgi:hypothetical protein